MQVAQVEEPAASAYVEPDTHEVHAVGVDCPVSELYVPAAQAVQLDAPDVRVE